MAEVGNVSGSLLALFPSSQEGPSALDAGRAEVLHFVKCAVVEMLEREREGERRIERRGEEKVRKRERERERERGY